MEEKRVHREGSMKKFAGPMKYFAAIAFLGFMGVVSVFVSTSLAQTHPAA